MQGLTFDLQAALAAQPQADDPLPDTASNADHPSLSPTDTAINAANSVHTDDIGHLPTSQSLSTPLDNELHSAKRKSSDNHDDSPSPTKDETNVLPVSKKQRRLQRRRTLKHKGNLNQTKRRLQCTIKRRIVPSMLAALQAYTTEEAVEPDIATWDTIPDDPSPIPPETDDDGAAVVLDELKTILEIFPISIWMTSKLLHKTAILSPSLH